MARWIGIVGRYLRRGAVAGLLALLLVVWVADAAFAVPGGLDTTFGGDGIVAADFSPGLDFAFDVAISDADGTIVAVGRAGGSGGRFAVVRYLPGGGLDPSFGGGDGKVLTNFTSGNDSAQAVGIQLDGKIVVAGYAAGSGGRFAVARYLPGGGLDPSFGGGDGKVFTNLTAGDDYAWALAIQPLDQKIVVVGGAGGSGGRFALARYATDGSLDGSFSGDGWVLTDFTNAYDYVDAVAIQPDGKIVAVGATNYYGSTPRFALARYGTGGGLDATFGGDGKVTTSFGASMAWAFGVAIQEDGKIVAAGQVDRNSALTRYLANGALDTTFNGDGRVTTSLGADWDWADEVMVQSDGRIVVAGTWAPSNDTRFVAARYLSGGTLDGSFSGDGKVATNLSAGTDWGIGAALQPSDGKIVVAGRTTGAGGRFALVRYLVA
jgi:uncharacterized delta-60 repeat protein